MFAFGGAFLLIFLVFMVLALAGTVFWIWALIDVLRRPDQQFAAAGQNKAVWALVVFFGHIVGVLLYLFIARAPLERAAAYR